jgi:hypothetical protein
MRPSKLGDKLWVPLKFCKTRYENPEEIAEAEIKFFFPEF